jgi:DNA-binding HxlR family transcriptional regulator
MAHSEKKSAKSAVSRTTPRAAPRGAGVRPTVGGPTVVGSAVGGSAARGDEEAGPDVGAMVESIVGCKWSIHVLEQIRRGVSRPGALARSAPGLTTKVLNQRLAKLVRFGIAERVSYPEVPPRVEYTLSAFGRRFVEVLESVERLKRDVRERRVPWEG